MAEIFIDEHMTKSIREQYLANEILNIGEIVEDNTTKKQVKIIDRGSNYITIESDEGIVSKKWLDQVTEVKQQETVITEPDFVVNESGQIKMFGFESRNFDLELSEFIVEQFSEFDDLYSKHQIIKLLELLPSIFYFI